MTVSQAGSCPLEGEGSPLSSQIVNRLIAGETVELATSNVSQGSCRSFTLVITRLSDNVIIDSMLATVDNI